jgi:predicted cupin superfamily sugar epimerase
VPFAILILKNQAACRADRAGEGFWKILFLHQHYDISMPTADDWIRHLGLDPHPEGGCYREVYRSGETIDAGGLPSRFDGSRVFSTSIYFLLRGHEVSRLHRIRQDEVWHYHDGSGLRIHVIDSTGHHTFIDLGRDLTRGQYPQTVVEAGCWFGAEVIDGEPFSLVGCTVAPGFEFDDFELADPAKLVQQFPAHAPLIERLTQSGS